MKSIPALSVLLAASALLPSVAAISFEVDTAGCDGDPFTGTNGITFTCNDSSTCGMGDTVTMAGEVEATSAFSDSEMVVEACVMGVCPEDYRRSAGTLCNWVTPVDGQECGEAGTYSVSGEEAIPSTDMDWLVNLSWAITVKIGVDEDCEGGGYQMAYSFAGLASLALVGAAYAARKKRGGDDYNDEDETGSQFVEMRDAAGAVV